MIKYLEQKKKKLCYYKKIQECHSIGQLFIFTSSINKSEIYSDS